jgi:catalase
MMQGFGVNTYTLHKPGGEQFFVKFHWIPELGVHSLVWDEALKISGQDPGEFLLRFVYSGRLHNWSDFHRKDLYEAIENGAFPKWTLCIQAIPASKEHDFDFDILDATKLWPEELVPLEEIGELVLDRAPEEFFPEVEQVAFCTSNVVPGIGFSDDPLLQGRNFSYLDTQLSRLGVNWQEVCLTGCTCAVRSLIH